MPRSTRSSTKKASETEPMEISESEDVAGPSQSSPRRKKKVSAGGGGDHDTDDVSSDPSTPSQSDREEEELVDDVEEGTGAPEDGKKKRKKKKKIKKKESVLLKAAISAKIDDSIDPNSVRTFIFSQEGHTLGNPLTYIISNYEDVVFCGYSVPHPAEHVFHLRIQCRNGVSAADVLKRGLNDLAEVCTVTKHCFKKAVKKYNRSRAPGGDEERGEGIILSESTFNC